MTLSPTRPASLAAQIAMLLCLSLLAIYWIRVAQLGGFSVKAYHLGMLAVMIATAASLSGISSAVRVVAFCSAWFLPYCLYLLFLYPAVIGSPGMGILVRQLFSLAAFVGVAAFLSRSADPAKILRRGALCGLVLFMIFTEYSAHRIGKSLIGAITDFLSSGSFQALIYKFFRPVFNSLEDTNDLVFGASIGNVIAVAMIVLALCFRIGWRKPGLDLLGSAAIAAALILALLLDSRSVVLGGVVCLCCASVARLGINRAISLGGMFRWCTIVIAGALLLLMVTLRSTAALDSVLSSFEFTDKSAESRMGQYSWALSLINDNPVWGHGYRLSDDGYPIHNLFLSSWAYVGLVGFVLTAIFYCCFSWIWIRTTISILVRPECWVLAGRPEWVLVLPILPLFRVWVSGGGGHPAYGEWFALAVFVGLVLRNELAAAESRVRPDEYRVSKLASPALRKSRPSGRVGGLAENAKPAQTQSTSRPRSRSMEA
jgi:hypothetical protein